MKTPSQINPVVIRSIHVDGPQPGKKAIVVGYSNARIDGQMSECFVAKFENGDIWFCPVMATKDYERVTS